VLKTRNSSIIYLWI